MVFRLDILWRRWWIGNFFFINFKKNLPIFVLTFWLNVGLGEIMFWLPFLLVFTSVWACGIDVLYPLSCNEFLYNSVALANSSLLQHNSGNPLLNKKRWTKNAILWKKCLFLRIYIWTDISLWHSKWLHIIPKKLSIFVE